MPQIDYTIQMLRTSVQDAKEQILNFEKRQIWKDYQYDFIKKKVEISKLEHEF